MASRSLSFEELTRALDWIGQGRQRVQEQIRTLATSMHQITESDALTGRVKEAIDLGIVNQHIPILKGLDESFRLLEREYRRMLRNAHEYMNETDSHAVIMGFAVAEMRDEVSQYHSYKLDFDNDFQRIYNSVSDYLDIRMPSNTNYDHRHDRLYTGLTSTFDRMHTFQFNWSEVTELKNKINKEITELENIVDLSFDNTTRLSVAGRTDFRDMMVDRMAMREQEIIDEATTLFIRWQEMTPRDAFLSMSSPPSDEEMIAWNLFVATFYDSWTPEQRQAIGSNQMFRGTFGIIIGAGAIIMTKGAAKPFVIAGWAAGGASIIFGASNIIEGSHNILLSWQWDVETQAFNPIRDTVFGGNQEAFDITNFWVNMFSMTTMYTGPHLPRGHVPPAFDAAKINELSRKTGLAPSQVEDILRHTRLSETQFLERLNQGQSVHQILGVTPLPVAPNGIGNSVTTNLGNTIDTTPSQNHSTIPKRPSPRATGQPNSSVDVVDSNGNIVTRRWFGPDGRAIRDVDMTNHGNLVKHPEWPHEHFWDWSSIPPRQPYIPQN